MMPSCTTCSGPIAQPALGVLAWSEEQTPLSDSPPRVTGMGTCHKGSCHDRISAAGATNWIELADLVDPVNAIRTLSSLLAGFRWSEDRVKRLVELAALLSGAAS